MQQHMGSLSAHRVIFILAIIYTGLLTWGSLTSLPPDPDVPDNFDKILHLTAYFGLTILWLAFLWRLRRSDQLLSKKTMFLVVLATFIYGIVIELLQGGLTEDRMTDGWDVIANTCGSLLAVFFFALFINKSERLKSIF